MQIVTKHCRFRKLQRWQFTVGTHLHFPSYIHDGIPPEAPSTCTLSAEPHNETPAPMGKQNNEAKVEILTLEERYILCVREALQRLSANANKNSRG